MKFMNMKRFASTVMAGVLTLSLAVPAFAASTPAPYSTTIEGGYEEIPISVVVPTTGTANINPYGLPVAMVKTDESTVNIVNQKITHEVLSIRNQGDVDLDVNVSSFMVVPKGDLAVSDTSAGTDNKTVKITLQVAGLDHAKYALAPDAEALGDVLIDAFAADDTWTGAGEVVAPTAAKGAAASGITAAKSSAKLATIGAATFTGGELSAYGNDSIALFRLKGELAAEPKNAGAPAPWVEADGFTATVVFKFTPAAPAASGGGGGTT